MRGRSADHLFAGRPSSSPYRFALALVRSTRPARWLRPEQQCAWFQAVRLLWVAATPRSPWPVPSRYGIPVWRRAALMPAAGPAQVAAAEFVCAAVLSAVALLPPAGPALPRIPGRALRRFSVAFAEQAVEFPAAVADPAEVDLVVAIVSSIPRRCAKPTARYR